MGNPYVNRQQPHKLSRKKTICWVLVLVVAGGLAAFSLGQILLTLNGYRASQKEYDVLRQQFAPAEEKPALGEEAAEQSAAVPTLMDINRDYIGWLYLSGTAIDYPVVQGRDNQTYLNTSFEGRHNSLGAIFMDAASSGGFYAPHAIVYGHNAKNGSMFGGLMDYSAQDFLKAHQDITVTLPTGETLVYQIFAARSAMADDEIYGYGAITTAELPALVKLLGAPAGTTHLLTLSTCTNRDKDERMLVFAARSDHG